MRTLQASSSPGGSHARTAPDTTGVLTRHRLLVTGPLPPPLGGVQLVIDMQRRSLLAQEFDLHVVDTSKRQLRWAVENPTWKTPLYMIRDFSRLLRALIRVRPHVVLVHAAPSLSFLRDWMFMVAARLAGAKVICHYHGTLHTRFPSGETRSGRLIGRFLMAAAHRVIVLGPTYQREMGKAWRRDDVTWAPNMADIALFRDMPADTPAPWLARGDKAVLFVGRLSAPKGIYDLFDAIPRVLERHPEANFVLVGVAERDALESVIRADAERRGIAPRLTFLGSLEGREKAAAFVTSRMIVVPSWTEAFPLVIPEAMAAGLPVIATTVGAIPDFVKDGEDGFLIAPKNPQMLAHSICRLLDDEGLRQRISKHVRERAPREFAIEIGCGKVAKVAKDMLVRVHSAKFNPDFRGRR
ncbi:MAG TPA: glycosyltransferase family 4 protein [Burkholderiales bacterium]|nr:glycosyltransferase family 4 protein [Burkholderiales bacterium]